MLEIAIIEDEEKEAAHLGFFLDRFSQENGVELRHSWHSSAAAFLDGYQCQYDLILMDIRLPDMDGMKAAQRLRELDSAVVLIFVTYLRLTTHWLLQRKKLWPGRVRSTDFSVP